jgi:hypothetical protein
MMKKLDVQHPRHVLLFVLVIVTGSLLLSPVFFPINDSKAESEDQGISAEFYYVEPSTQLLEMKLNSSSKTDINIDNIRISEVETWQGVLPRYVISIHYTNFNNDAAERRFVFVVRSKIGVPWIIADTPIKVLDSASDIDQTIWFAFNVNRNILQSNPNIPASWFAEVANSTIEVMIVDQPGINIAGVGGITVDGKPSLPPFISEDIVVFDK